MRILLFIARFLGICGVMSWLVVGLAFFHQFVEWWYCFPDLCEPHWLNQLFVNIIPPFAFLGYIDFLLFGLIKIINWQPIKTKISNGNKL